MKLIYGQQFAHSSKNTASEVNCQSCLDVDGRMVRWQWSMQREVGYRRPTSWDGIFWPQSLADSRRFSLNDHNVSFSVRNTKDLQLSCLHVAIYMCSCLHVAVHGNLVSNLQRKHLVNLVSTCSMHPVNERKSRRSDLMLCLMMTVPGRQKR